MTNEVRPIRSSEAFVGRERELSVLRDRLDAAGRGEGGIAFIAGEPGIGKTALCEQLAAYAESTGAQTLFGHCYDEGSIPYLPFVEVLRSYAGRRDPDALRQELGAGAADIVRLLPEIGSVMQVDPRPAGDPEADRWQLFEAVGTLLRDAAAAQPLLLVLEDLHWADRGTLDLLIHVARNLKGSRVLVVGSYRDVEVDRAHPLSAALGELRRIGSFSRIHLQGLDVGEVHLLYGELRGNQVPLAEAERVHGQTEGNPLFVQEVVRYLVQAGLEPHDGGDATSIIPEDLRDMIGLRLNRLSQDCNQALAVASVIGREFDLATLQRVADLEEETLENAIEEAERAGVLQDQSRPGAVRYRFAHALFRQTLYDEISAPRRLRHHQQIARVLEEEYAARLEEHSAELAEHFSHSTDAPDLTKAVHYSDLAAGRAMSVFAYGEAVRLLERALDLQELFNPQDKALLASLLFQLGQLMKTISSGTSPRIIEYFSRSLAVYENIGDQLNAAKIHVALGTALSGGMNSDFGLARVHLQAATRILANDPTDTTQLEAHVALARLVHWGMHTEEALRLSREAMEKAEKLHSQTRWWIEAAAILGHNLVAAGDLAAGFEVLEQTRQRANDIEDPRGQTAGGIISAIWTGFQMYLLADPNETRARFDLELGHSRHQTPGHDAVLTSRAVALGLAGNINEALRISNELPDIGAAVASMYPHPLVAFWGGDWPTAESLWRKEMALHKSRGNPWSAATFAIWLAKVLFIRGDSSGSEALLNALLDTSREAPHVPLVLIASTELGLLCATTGRWNEAMPHLALCREILAKGEDWRGLAGRVALAEAAVAVADGDLGAAEPHFARAIEVFERYSLPWDKAEALHLWGRALIKARRRAAAANKLDAALEIYVHHGAGQPWIERVEADKKRLLSNGRTIAIHPDDLSEREIEVLRLIAVGQSNQQIADELVLSLNTVQRHVSNILAKTGLANRTEAASYAHRHDLAN